MNLLLQTLETIALLCQTELGVATGKIAEERRLSCIRYYVECTCPRLICKHDEVPGMLIGCTMMRTKDEPIPKKQGAK
jgi:hypothetical protein